MMISEPPGWSWTTGKLLSCSCRSCWILAYDIAVAMLGQTLSYSLSTICKQIRKRDHLHENRDEFVPGWKSLLDEKNRLHKGNHHRNPRRKLSRPRQTDPARSQILPACAFRFLVFRASGVFLSRHVKFILVLGTGMRSPWDELTPPQSHVNVVARRWFVPGQLASREKYSYANGP